MTAHNSVTRAAPGAFGVLHSKLSRERTPPNLVRIARMLWRMLTNIHLHREVLRLVKLQPLDDVVESNPKFAVKYLATRYLMRGFTVAERGTCFLHHYETLRNTCPLPALRQILHWELGLYRTFEEGKCIDVTLGRSRPSDNEGELSLFLKIDGEVILTLSFTIVPGRVVKSEQADVLLISQLQGTLGCDRRQMKLATKAMEGVRPRGLLLAALEGVAVALGIREIAAVNATSQIAYCEEYAASFMHGYDDFFAEMGFVKSVGAIFLSPVPIREKPLSCIKHGHRLLVKKRRAFREKIRQACTESFLRNASQSVGATEEVKANARSESYRRESSPDLPLSRRILG